MSIPPILIRNQNRWPSDVELWLVNVDLSKSDVEIKGFLSEDERKRMARFVRRDDRVRFGFARSTLRKILGRQLACDPARLDFEAGAYGRPSLIGHPRVSFNVSHSGARILIGVSMLRTVGVDIEAENASLDWRTLLDSVCVPDEVPHILGTVDFYKCWTAKEALLKATGVGIGVDRGLKSIDLANRRMPAGFNFNWLNEIDGYAAAVAFGTYADISVAPARDLHI
jgi:4'-phosphopantetheinyl transferase